MYTILRTYLRTSFARALVPNHKLGQIQLMRALAAITVAIGHILHEAQGMAPSEYMTQLNSVPWAFGVDVFFIISGFIMMHTTQAEFGKRGATGRFLTRRLVRIAPPYWAFTSLMVAIALVMPKALDTTVFTPLHAALSYLFIPHADPASTTGGIHPILGLGWTLVYEMFFYLMFSLALMFPKKQGLSLLLAAFLMLFLGARCGTFTPTLNTFWGDSILFEFLLGIMVSLLYQKGALPRSALLGCLALAMAGWAATDYLPALAAQRFYLMGLPALAVFVLMGQLPPKLNKGPLAPLFTGLVIIGDASYTLYLSHPFALTAVKMVAKPVLAMAHFSPFAMASYVVASLLAAIAGAFLFYALLERPVTSYLHQKLCKKA